MPISRKQYRLTWSRGYESPYEDAYVSEKRFWTKPALERHIWILTADEPWRAWNKESARFGPNDFVCCFSSECECGQELTFAEDTRKRREGLRPIIWMKLEERIVTRGDWSEAVLSTPYKQR
jgi:hypothetical protein